MENTLLQAKATLPQYNRDSLKARIVHLGFGALGCVTYVRSYSKCCRFTYRRKLANFALLDTNLETDGLPVIRSGH